MKELTPEKIVENWDKFRQLCSKVGERSSSVLKMVDELEDRLSICPASAKVEHHLPFPGGLIDHSIRTLTNALTIWKTFFPGADSVTKESIVLVSLMHDLGKCGDERGNDFYVPQASQWHVDRGENYTYNRNIQYMPHAHRSVYLLQRYGIRLSDEEFIAILTHDGTFAEENKPYSMKEPTLGVIVSMADYIATVQEKSLD